MLDLNLLRTFIAVAESRRISQAAQLLGLPKSTVSRHISKMETDLNARLFDRHADGFELTSYGRRLFNDSRPAMHTLTGLFSGKAVDDFENTLTIHSPAIYARGVLATIVDDFLTDYPDSSIEIQIGDRHTVPNPDKADLFVCVGLSPGREFETFFLGYVEAKLFASPTLFKDKDAPATPAELADWPLLIDDCLPGERSRISMICKGRSVRPTTGPARLATREPEILRTSALKGCGIVRLPVFMAEGYLEQGLLVPVLPDCILDRWSVLLARPRKNRNRWASEFAEYVCDRLAVK